MESAVKNPSKSRRHNTKVGFTCVSECKIQKCRKDTPLFSFNLEERRKFCKGCLDFFKFDSPLLSSTAEKSQFDDFGRMKSSMNTMKYEKIT